MTRKKTVKGPNFEQEPEKDPAIPEASAEAFKAEIPEAIKARIKHEEANISAEISRFQEAKREEVLQFVTTKQNEFHYFCDVLLSGHCLSVGLIAPKGKKIKPDAEFDFLIAE